MTGALREALQASELLIDDIQAAGCGIVVTITDGREVVQLRAEPEGAVKRTVRPVTAPVSTSHRG